MKPVRLLILSAIVLIVSLCPLAAREHSQIIEVNDYTYEIDVGGFRDPLNESIIIENLGDTPLVNPRITVDGKYDWFDVEAIAREATAGCVTDEERAYAIFNFVRNNSHHLDPPGDQETLNPVVYFNLYGYANCGYHASVAVSLARSIGMKARVWEVWHHTVNEYWFNNAWHMLDCDIEIYYLMNDNRTVASIPQLWADQKVTGGLRENVPLTTFSKRTARIHGEYTDIDGNILYDRPPRPGSQGKRYYYAEDHCYVQSGYDGYTYEHHDMSMTLRPNESLTRNWRGGDVYYDYRRHNDLFEKEGQIWRKPIRHGDGRIVWRPNLDSPDAKKWVAGAYNVLWSEDDSKPNVHVKNKHGGIWDVPSFVNFAIRTPYVIIGGDLKAKVHRDGASDWDRLNVLLSSGREGWERQSVWRAPEGATGSMDVDVDMDEPLYPNGMRGNHDYRVRFQMTANENNSPPGQTGIESVEMSADIQCAPNSLPALSLGKNVVRYRDETAGPHKVKITHVWSERSDNHPPAPPVKAVSPADGATVKSLAPKFKWAASKDADKGDKVADYRVTVSLDPQCRWPLSTSLITETGSGAAEWTIDDGWLNPDTTYYWKIQAKDSNNLWGDWSRPYRFKTGN
ncbi:transglutaminase family protein [candidate division KSB1 bacterium]